MRENQTRKLTAAALMAAMVYVATYIGTALPFSGYVHLGDAAVYLSGILLGPQYGLMAAAVGSGLADGLKGWAIYIPATIVLKGVMAYCAGKARDKDLRSMIVMMSIGGLVMVAGYYLYEVILYGTVLGPIVNIPWNILQFVVGTIIALFLMKPFKQFRI